MQDTGTRELPRRLWSGSERASASENRKEETDASPALDLQERGQWEDGREGVEKEGGVKGYWDFNLQDRKNGWN